MSVSRTVSEIFSKCAQSMHALKILRSHGMSSDALKVIYKSVVLTKLLYASPAWWGFATSADNSNGFKHSCVDESCSTCTALSTPRCHNVCTVQDTDDELFSAVMANSHHVLHHMLPDRTSHPYTLRPRRHDCTLTVKEDARNFVIRLLYKDMYF